MIQKFEGWEKVEEQLSSLAHDPAIELNDGQRASLLAIATRLKKNGVIIADEVGMGKTRIAAAVARSVIAAGGRVAILVPPGLGYQWSKELRGAGIEVPPILRSLDAYLNAWNAEEREDKWGDCQTILLSHAFCNWSLKSSTKKNWKWTLLPAVLKLLAKQYRASSRVRIGGANKIKFDDQRVTNAAEWIVKNGAKENLEALSSNKNINLWGGESPLFVPKNYSKESDFREALEKVVGIGLGEFDLVIIDEAHKSRGRESNLNSLLNQVVLRSTVARFMAMTATPVEIDATQWTQMLKRIHVDEQSKVVANTAILNYAKAVDKVRCCLSDKESREQFKAAAKAFKCALDPYLIRRDKRTDPAVIKFSNASGEGYHAYRREREILIDTAHLSLDWKCTVCAAEALSFSSRQSDNAKGKRLRLTLGNGHGIAALIDQLQRVDKDDIEQTETEDIAIDMSQFHPVIEDGIDKRLQRSAWWQNVMVKPFKKNQSALFDHPAILAAVTEIERVCQQGEKVLVFGRFTRPLHALVQILNAREMLRSLDNKKPWPQSKVHETEWAAINAAHQQLGRHGKLDKQSLDELLGQRYKELEQQRRTFREKLISCMEVGFAHKKENNRVLALFDAFKTEVSQDFENGDGDDGQVLTLVARHTHELMRSDIENAVPADFAQAFIDLIEAQSDVDKVETDVDERLDDVKVLDAWTSFKTVLEDEYSSKEGGYARLMFGETKPATRRFLQLAFNRKQGHPKVLVAQSLVGREGLNLHKACRTVVLLHPEWNPGVVEQQIGRVDRIGSLWEEQLNDAVANGKVNDELPRIEICPVVFQGTYDEKNWEVLHDRWEDLRAQLHGIVISPRIAQKYSHSDEIVAEINDSAPEFFPRN